MARRLCLSCSAFLVLGVRERVAALRERIGEKGACLFTEPSLNNALPSEIQPMQGLQGHISWLAWNTSSFPIGQPPTGIRVTLEL